MWQFKTITGQIFKRKTVFIDNVFFRLHYRVTFWLLVLGCTLVCTRQYIGEHIHCIADKQLKNVINTFCFFSTTFTVVKHQSSNHSAHPGVGPHVPGDRITHHAYYQWVPFVLFGQAMTFYLGHYLWKKKEGQRLSSWQKHPVPEQEVLLRLHVNRDWSKWLVTCECINLANLVLQVYLTNRFLGGRFFELGVSSWDYLDMVFPKVTKCTFRQYGPSGTIMTRDSLCVVALNIVNEKIYWILWMWYLVLAAACVLGLCWRLFTFFFHSNGCLSTVVWSNVTPGAHISRAQAQAVAQHCTFSDWLFLYYISKNISSKEFAAVISALSRPFTPPSIQLGFPAYSKIPQQDNDKLSLDCPDKSESYC